MDGGQKAPDSRRFSVVPAAIPNDQQPSRSDAGATRKSDDLRNFVRSRQTVDNFKGTDLTGDLRNAIRWLYTNNPFYVVSAVLVLYGLRISFDASGAGFDTSALMISLAAYTALLAGAAWFLIRYGNLWEDVRTLLLLVVLMLLATSASFDEPLELTVENPGGSIPLLFYGALAFAIVVCEGLLRGIRLRLPAGFRLPFYAILATFYLYPVLLIQWMRNPWAASINWGLFCFSTVMGGLFLTLLPAVRRGPSYVDNNGSPWKWPWYPWILFGVLGFGVCVRAYYLCYTLHGVVGFRSIFGLHFLVPFVFAANILLLEAGIVSHRKGVIRLALLLPVGLVALAMTASPLDAADLGFLKLFQSTLHASPLFLTLSAVTAFYFVALLRRVPDAWLAASLALIAISFCGPNTFNPDTLAGPVGLPILAAGGLFLIVGVLRRHAVACLLGAWCAVAATWIDFHETCFGAYHGAIPVHLLLASILVVGAIFRDARGRWIQNLGAAAILLLALCCRKLPVLAFCRPAVRRADLLPALCRGCGGRLWFSGEEPLVLRQRIRQPVRLGGGNGGERLPPSPKCGRRPELHRLGSGLLPCGDCSEPVENGALAAALLARAKEGLGSGLFGRHPHGFHRHNPHGQKNRSNAESPASRNRLRDRPPFAVRRFSKPFFGDFCQPRCILSTLTYKIPVFQIVEEETWLATKNQRRMA